MTEGIRCRVTARAARWPDDDGAFNRSGESGVDPVARQKQALDRRLGRGRGGAPGASENVARRSRTTDPLRTVRRSRGRQCSRTSRSAIAISSSLAAPQSPRRRSTRARGATTAPPTMARRSKHPLEGAARQADAADRRMTAAVEPQVDGDDRRAGEARRASRPWPASAGGMHRTAHRTQTTAPSQSRSARRCARRARARR